MAGRFNEILVGRYNRFLQKFFSMKGGPPAPQLASEIMTALPLMHGRENRYLEDWRTFGGSIAVGAVAAQDDVIRLNNPKTSNIVAVVESITLTFTVALSEAVMEFSNSDSGPLAATVTPAAFDNRFQPPGSGSNGAACILSGTNNIGQGTHFVFGDVQIATAGLTSAEQINYENQEITLLPNSDLQIRSTSLNLAMRCSIRWRERSLEDSERA